MRIKILFFLPLISLFLFSGCKFWENFSKKEEVVVVKKEVVEEKAPLQTEDLTKNGKEEKTSEVMNITDMKKFEAKILNSKQPAVIKFSAPWCGACNIMQPIFEAAAKNDKFKNINFVLIDIDKADDIAQKYDIQGIPIFVFIVDGKEKDRVIGEIKEKDFHENITEVLGK